MEFQHLKQMQGKKQSGQKRRFRSSDLKRRLYEVGMSTSSQFKSLLDPALQRPSMSHVLRVPHSPHSQTQQNFYIRKQSHQRNTRTPNSSYSPSLATPSKHLMDKLTHSRRRHFAPPMQDILNTVITQDTVVEETNVVCHTPLSPKLCPQTSLDEYIGLVLRRTANIDEFLYLIRKEDVEDNIYQLEIVSFQSVKEKEHANGFQYYTVSKKGFCHYVNGKPNVFIEIEEWLNEKDIYHRIKKLKFFNRFRRWKIIKMWKRTVVRHRIQVTAAQLNEKLFFLAPEMCSCLFEVRHISLQLTRNIFLLSKNEGNYSLESFKHCQEKCRRETSLVIQQFSRKSRQTVRACFDSNLTQLRQQLLTKNQEKAFPTNATHNPKDNAFQALGFSKMSYEHRSKLRKMTAKFVRFSYLVDYIYLAALANTFNEQVNEFLARLQLIQIAEQVKLRFDDPKAEEIDKDKMFSIHLCCNFRSIPSNMLTPHANTQSRSFIPLYDVQTTDTLQRKYYQQCTEVDNSQRMNCIDICEWWLSMRPTLQEIFDQFHMLFKHCLSSLKYFQRWSRHRQMQKYVSILEEWDDVVCDNWTICESDTLDPLTIIDSLDDSLVRIKEIIAQSQSKLKHSITKLLTDPLNCYWHNSLFNISLLQSPTLIDPAQTLESFLGYSTRLVERCSQEIPTRIELGIFTLHLDGVKGSLVRAFQTGKDILCNDLPELVQQRTTALNDWLVDYCTKLKEQILNIDDFLRIVKILHEVETHFNSKKQLCNDLSQMYQTMQTYRIETKRRKNFETVTLKLKDQLQQSIATVQQNIQRKAETYCREVLKYYLPNLLRDVEKIKEQVQAPRMLELHTPRAEILAELTRIQLKYSNLVVRKEQCLQYISVLKLNEGSLDELNVLHTQIQSRILLWSTFSQWEQFIKEINHQPLSQLDLKPLSTCISTYSQTLSTLTLTLPQNQALTAFSHQLNRYLVNVPLLLGLNQSLSQEHWTEIYSIAGTKLNLKAKDFTLLQFFESKVGEHAAHIHTIFDNSRLQIALQSQYNGLYEAFKNITAKSRLEGRFNIVANDEEIVNQLNDTVCTLSKILANKHSSSLRLNCTLTGDSTGILLNTVLTWSKVQSRLILADKHCKLLDVKRIPDYVQFQNAQKIYKSISKVFLSKSSEEGVKLYKVFVPGLEDKFNQIIESVSKVEQNIAHILLQRKKAHPLLLLFSNAQLLDILNESMNLESAAKILFPALAHLQIEGEKIAGLLTIDGEKFTKSGISTIAEIEQTLSQIGDIFQENNKRSIRSCKYKTVQTSISSLVEMYNIQHLLAISKVDFNNYTEISIENQNESGDSLKQFFKVMKKDTSEDIKQRNKYTSKHTLIKYDTLLMQCLLHQDILDSLITLHVTSFDDYHWLKQLRFIWDEAEESNITVKQLHTSIKYGNDFVGSNAKVLLSSDPFLLAAFKHHTHTFFTASTYELQRCMYSLGYKSQVFHCTPSTTPIQLDQFLKGTKHATAFPILNTPHLLSFPLNNYQLYNPNVLLMHDDLQPPTILNTHSSPIFFTAHPSHLSIPSFQGKMRMVGHCSFDKQYYLKAMRIYEQEYRSTLCKLHSLAQYLNVSVDEWHFFDSHLNGEDVSGEVLLQNLLQVVKSNSSADVFHRIQQHFISLEKVPASLFETFPQEARAELGSEYHKINQIKRAFIDKRIIFILGSDKSIQTHLRNIYPQYQFTALYADEEQTIPLYKNGLEVIYLQGITSALLMQLHENIPPENKKIAIHIENINPALIGIYPIISTSYTIQSFKYQLEKWAQKYLSLAHHKLFIKLIAQLVIPAIQCEQKKQLESIAHAFITVLQSLLPMRNVSLQPSRAIQTINNVLHAVIYAVIITFKHHLEVRSKVQLLISKHIDLNYIWECIDDNQLGLIPFAFQGKKISFEDHAVNLIQVCQQMPHQYIPTKQYLHNCLLFDRIYYNTQSAVFVQGHSKNTFLTVYKHYGQISNSLNATYLNTNIKKKNFKNTLSRVLYPHSLSKIGPKINYSHAIIMIDDVGKTPINENSQQNILICYLLQKYKQFALGKKYLVDNIHLMLSGKYNNKFNGMAVRIHLPSADMKNIYKSLFTLQLDNGQVFKEKIIQTTQSIIHLLLSSNEIREQQAINNKISLYLQLNYLKLKDPANALKEVQKCWVTLLQDLFPQEKVREQLLRQKMEVKGSLYSNLQKKEKGSVRKVEIESVRDIKRIYHLVYEHLQKHQEEKLQFSHFDETVKQIIKMTNSLMVKNGYVLRGSQAIGRTHFTRLVASLQGWAFIPCNDMQTDVHSTMKYNSQPTNIFSSFNEIQNYSSNSIVNAIASRLSSDDTTPCIIFKKVFNEKDIAQVEQYLAMDFQHQIYSSYRREGRQKTGEHTYPCPKATLKQIEQLCNNIKLVVSIEREELILKDNHNSTVSVLRDVGADAIGQYNEKLLEVEEMQCGPTPKQILKEIYSYEKISLKASEDSMRLFISFLATIREQSAETMAKFNSLKHVKGTIQRISSTLTDEIAAHQDKNDVWIKEKSGLLANIQKLLEVYNLCFVLLKDTIHQGERIALYKEEMYAVTAAYFIHLSHLPFVQRRNKLKKWYVDIPSINNLAPLQALQYSDIKQKQDKFNAQQNECRFSLLPLLLLSQKQFKTEPVQSLQDYYQNMSIIMHSIKPVLIKDKIGKAKPWLHNRSFIILPQESVGLFDLLKEALSKPCNIIFQITNQHTLDHIEQCFIYNLLYLAEGVQTVVLRGEQVEVSPAAKVYLMIGDSISVKTQQFVVVLFNESERMLQKHISHHVWANSHPQYPSLVDSVRKEKHLSSDCEETALSIGQLLQNLVGDGGVSEEQLIGKLTTATQVDKILTKIQFNKFKEKYQLMQTLKTNIQQAVLPSTSLHLHYTHIIIDVISVLEGRDKLAYIAEVMSVMKEAMSKRIITTPESILLFALRHFGWRFCPKDYLSFALLVVSKVKNIDLKAITLDTEEKVKEFIIGSMVELLGKRDDVMQMEQICGFMAVGPQIVKVRMNKCIGDKCSSKLSHLKMCYEEKSEKNKSFKMYPQISEEMFRNKICGKAQEINKDNVENLEKNNLNQEIVIYDDEKLALKIFGEQKSRGIIVYSVVTHNKISQTQYLINADNQLQIFYEIIRRLNQNIQEKRVSNVVIKGLSNKSIEQTIQQKQQPKKQIKQNNRVQSVKQFICCFKNLLHFTCKELNLMPVIISQDQFCVNLNVCLKTLETLIKVSPFLQKKLTPFIELLHSQRNFQDAIKLLKIETDEIIVRMNKTQMKKNMNEKMKSLLFQTTWLIKFNKTVCFNPPSRLKRIGQKLQQFVSILCEPTKIVVQARKQSYQRRGSCAVVRQIQKRVIKEAIQIFQPNNGLVTLIYKRQAQEIQRVFRKIIASLTSLIYKIHQITSNQCQNILLTKEQLQILTYLEQNMFPPHWTLLIHNVQCNISQARGAVVNLIQKRNSLLQVPNPRFLDLSYISRPLTLLQVYFGTDDFSQYALTQSAEGDQYVQVANAFAGGWKFTGDCYMESVNDTKSNNIGPIFIVRKNGNVPVLVQGEKQVEMYGVIKKNYHPTTKFTLSFNNKL